MRLKHKKKTFNFNNLTANFHPDFDLLHSIEELTRRYTWDKWDSVADSNLGLLAYVHTPQGIGRFLMSI